MVKFNDHEFGAVQVWTAKGELENYTSMNKIVGWRIEDHISGTMQKGFYLHATKGGKQIGIAISKASLEYMLKIVNNDV